MCNYGRFDLSTGEYGILKLYLDRALRSNDYGCITTSCFGYSSIVPLPRDPGLVTTVLSRPGDMNHSLSIVLYTLDLTCSSLGGLSSVTDYRGDNVCLSLLDLPSTDCLDCCNEWTNFGQFPIRCLTFEHWWF